MSRVLLLQAQRACALCVLCVCSAVCAGREDIDVRMLGSGRPFILDIVNARRLVPPPAQLRRMEAAVAEVRRSGSVRMVVVVVVVVVAIAAAGRAYCEHRPLPLALALHSTCRPAAAAWRCGARTPPRPRRCSA